MLTPPRRLRLSDYANSTFQLSSDYSARSGQFDTNFAPFQRGMLDAITDPEVNEVVFMTSSQVGKSVILMIALAYYMDIDPAPILLVFPTERLGKDFSKDRISAMIRDNPSLDALFTSSKRNPDNTVLHKRYPGGSLAIVSAQSPTDLSSRPIRIVLMDEVDRMPLNVGDGGIQEGDPVTLAAKRSLTFWNSKLVLTSTPTVKGLSRIEKSYIGSDQRVYLVPCPYCKHKQELRWEQVEWTKEEGEHKPETAVYVCEECKERIPHELKRSMLAKGEWYAQNPDSNVAGFHVSELYSPWRTWGQVAEAFLEAKTKGIDVIRAWENTSLGRTYEEEALEVDDSMLLSRREAYPGDKLPKDALLVTAGLDTQDGWISILINAWGMNEENWIVERIEVRGEPTESYVWDLVTEELQRTYETEDGRTLRIEQACIDSAGHYTQAVYQYVKSVERHIPIVAVVGRAGNDRHIISAPSQKRSGKDRRGVKLYIVGVDGAKTLLYNRLSIKEHGTGYIHLPIHESINEQFCRELTAEKRVRKFSKGRPYFQWVSLQARNEALDCWVYSYAALLLRRPNWTKLVQSVKPKEEQAKVNRAIEEHRQRVRPRKRTNYAQNWRQ